MQAILEGIPGPIPDQSRQTADRLTRPVQMLAPGRLVDATGRPFEFTADDIQLYAENFDPDDPPPIVLDNELSARSTVGRIRALWVDHERPRLAGVPVLMGSWEFLGQENVEKVLDGRFSRVNGRFGYGPEPFSKVVVAGSVVWRGGYDRGPGDRAQILASAASLSAPSGATCASTLDEAAQAAQALLAECDLGLEELGLALGRATLSGADTGPLLTRIERLKTVRAKALSILGDASAAFVREKATSEEAQLLANARSLGLL